MLRCPGFSKDGKTAESQIVLGLLVSRDGYPLSYNIFNADQALDIAKTISTVTVVLPDGTMGTRTMLITDEHRLLAPLLPSNF